MRRLIVLLVAGLAACADVESEHVALPVQLSPLITRVSDLSFDLNDRIGLSIVRSSGDYVTNSLLTYDGSTFVGDNLLWYNNISETSTLIAYHPYQALGVPTTFAVATNQVAGCSGSDLLVAQKTGVTPVISAVAMTFRHLLSKLVITVTNNSSATIEKILIGGCVTSATTDIAAQRVVVSPGAAATEITTHPVAAGLTYQAILIPQSAAITISVVASDGKLRSRTLPMHTLISGARYAAAIIMTNVDMSLTLSGSIGDWTDGGAIEPETPSGGSTLQYQGETYALTTIGSRVWMENLRYIPASASIGHGVWYADNSVSTVKQYGLLYTLAVAMGKTPPDDGSLAGVQGICPAGWHIPTAIDLQDLITNYASAPVGFISLSGAYVNGSNVKFNSSGYLMSSTYGDTSGKYSYLVQSSLSPQLIPYAVTAGVSLRCVKLVQ